MCIVVVLQKCWRKFSNLLAVFDFWVVLQASFIVALYLFKIFANLNEIYFGSILGRVN